MNQHRAEYSFTLGDREVTIPADFNAIAAIEARLGLGIFEIHQKGIELKLGLSQIAAIFHAALKASGDTRLTYEQVGAALHQMGTNQALIHALTYLVAAQKAPAVEEGKSPGE